MKLYVLRFDMYGDWAIENGASDIIGVYDSREKVLMKLKELLLEEQNKGHIVGIYADTIEEFINDVLKNDNDHLFIDIYSNLDCYDRGYNEGCYIIEPRFLNNCHNINMDSNIVGASAKINLYTHKGFPMALPSMIIMGNSVIEFGDNMRKWEFNSKAICDNLNKLEKKLTTKDWEVTLDIENMITLKGVDSCGNIRYLTIEKGV